MKKSCQIHQDGLSSFQFSSLLLFETCFPGDPGKCSPSSSVLLGGVPALEFGPQGSSDSDLTMFGHGGLSQMGTKGCFPGDRDGLGAQASCWSPGGLFWGEGWGVGRRKMSAC